MHYVTICKYHVYVIHFDHELDEQNYIVLLMVEDTRIYCNDIIHFDSKLDEQNYID